MTDAGASAEGVSLWVCVCLINALFGVCVCIACAFVYV